MKTLVLYHAKWCGHCKRLTQKGGDPGGWTKLKQLSDDGKLNFKLKAIEEQQMTPAQKTKIPGFPTIILQDGGGKKIADYMGNRTAEDMIQFVKSHTQRGGRKKRRKRRRKTKRRRRTRKKCRRRRRRTRRR